MYYWHRVNPNEMTDSELRVELQMALISYEAAVVNSPVWNAAAARMRNVRHEMLMREREQYRRELLSV